MTKIEQAYLTGFIKAADIYSMLKRDEGFRPNSYLDTLGHKTIGYGSTNPTWLAAGHVTEPQAATELTNHVHSVISNLKQRLGTNTFNTLPQPAQMSLENLGYQTGDIQKWPKLMAAVKSHNWGNAVNELRNSVVNTQTPGRNLERINLMQQAGR
jgi:GH24 family phage-related lysozyme (muramidase)